MSHHPTDTSDEGWFLGTGGALWKIALPLPEDLATAHAAGQLTRVNPDGTPYTGTTTPGPVEPPKPTASKRAWLEWAIACGADPDEAAAATKHDLIDTYGRTPATGTDEQAAQTEQEPTDKG